jgi:5-methylcytosine-specific restriction endonuclease McrA
MRKRNRRNAKRKKRRGRRLRLQPKHRGSHRVSHDVRDKVLARDGYHCQHCGTSGSTHNKLTMHHQIYRRHGGQSTVDNLITLCQSCHSDYHRKMG